MLLSWDIYYGPGTPCDSFEVSFIYEKDMLDTLLAATRFRAEHGGERVFTGVVDDFELRADDSGLLAVVRGRSLAALLLDNEARAAEYYPASLGLILENHVYPWGVENVRAGSFPAVQGFKVESGQSQWGVVENFAWFCGGVRPRFSRDGTLLLNGEAGRSLDIPTGFALGEQSYKFSRYGVVSSVLVCNKSTGASSLVEDEDFISRGGNCRRVVTVPKAMQYDAMRHTGSYQLERSREGAETLSLSMPELFAAFPGDTVALSDCALGLCGSFSVTSARCLADGESAGTIISLTKTGG